jgi:hypothetical protein
LNQPLQAGSIERQKECLDIGHVDEAFLSLVKPF